MPMISPVFFPAGRSVCSSWAMRLPTVDGGSARESNADFDQDLLNAQVKRMLDLGVNYFDTSPAYCRGQSERLLGEALAKSGYARRDYLIATKLSNFAKQQYPLSECKKMLDRSLEALRTDYVDNYLLHSIGSGGYENFLSRYVDNGAVDWLVEERKSGRIRNLGFSFHGDVKVFDYLLEQHDKYRWDFVQIQLNYLDWQHAKATNPNNVDAEYLYAELQKRNIPAVIMEPLLGGRLARVPDYIVARLKQREPERSVASWAFRFAGTFPGVLTVLSGMTLLEHLQDNLRSYCPLSPLSDEDMAFLQEVAGEIAGLDTVPCNECDYCMPCPYGIDIPGIFHHYNKCLNEGNIPHETQDANYRKARRAYLVSYDRAIPKVRQADHCIGCSQCVSHCPQRIKIPRELHRISALIEQMRQHPEW